MWSQEQQDSLESLKRAISQPPVLRMADFSENFILQMNVNSVALGGAVPSQEINGVRQPIANASRALSAQEPKASSI